MTTLPLHVRFTASHCGIVVADADDLGYTIQVGREIRHYLGWKLYGPLFPRDVRGLDLTHQPITICVNPAIEPVAFDGLDDPRRDIARHKALRHDREVGMHEDAAVERSNRFCQAKRFD